MDYIGFECPVCKKPFHAYEDIVVCPECGTPHHRECYQSEGHCHFEDKHSENYEFKTNENQTDTADNAVAECKICGYKNKEDALFCSHCGNSINSQQANQGQSVPFNPYYGQANMGQTDAVNPKEELESGVTVEEVAKFVRNSTPYYTRVFQNIKRYSKSRFNFSAFLFSGGFLLYRKQYKRGAVFTVIMAILMITATFITYSTAYQNMAVELYNAVGLTSAVSFSDVMKIYSFTKNMSSSDLLLFYLPTLLQLIQYAIMFYLGFTANRTYYKSCIKEISEIKATAKDKTEADSLFQSRGGVNTALAISIFVVYIIITVLPTYF